ncbi:MAG: MBL fold metallo-hydrolase [Clostridia bacterium]|nr:MBL fold metallo-hydrolase [Clostridia bacterium]
MKIIQLRNFTPVQMTGFFILTNEGKVIAVDGGNASDTDGFLEALEEYTGEKSHRIDCWFMTHPHDDHFGVFKELTERAGRGLEIPECGVFCCTKQPDEFGKNETIFANQIVEFNAAVRNTSYPVHYFKEKEVFDFGSLTVEVLRTWDPGITANAFNNSSAVLKFTEKRGLKKDFVFIFLGDLGIEGGLQLIEKCPEGIKADAVQMAHHGQNGVSREVYEKIAPRFAFFATPDWLWYNTIDPQKPGQGPFKTLEVRAWMEELNAVPLRACEKNVLLDTAWVD